MTAGFNRKVGRLGATGRTGLFQGLITALRGLELKALAVCNPLH
jgi:hypothetical protein